MTDYTSGGSSKQDRVSEWELGLPDGDDLVPLSQPLITPQVALAFNITPELSYWTNLDVTRAAEKTISTICGQYQNNNFKSPDDQLVTKRARLVWTPQLHKRFVDVVAHVGIENAVPKKLMEMMNVEGLTRENVASHLQKYRLYLKRTQR